MNCPCVSNLLATSTTTLCTHSSVSPQQCSNFPTNFPKLQKLPCITQSTTFYMQLLKQFSALRAIPEISKNHFIKSYLNKFPQTSGNYQQKSHQFSIFLPLIFRFYMLQIRKWLIKLNLFCIWIVIYKRNERCLNLYCNFTVNLKFSDHIFL